MNHIAHLCQCSLARYSAHIVRCPVDLLRCMDCQSALSSTPHRSHTAPITL